MLPETEPTLTPEQIAQLEQARKLIPQLQKAIRTAESAGLDVAAQKAQLLDLQTQLDKLYRVYVKRTITTIGA